MDDATLTSLPDDPRALKAMILTLARERDQIKRESDAVLHERDIAIHRCDKLTLERDRWKLKHDEKEIDRLRLEVELLRYKKWYYGRKADQLATEQDIAQMLLSFSEQLEAQPVDLNDVPADVDLTGVETKTIRRVKRGRRNLAAFEDLPVTRKEYDLSEQDKPCPCCGKMREKIGSEASWQIEYIPGRFERIEHLRHKYACRHCDQNGEGGNIELADKPRQPIEKGLAAPGLLAFTVTSKFADYLPLYRLEAIFERNGFEIDRATLSIWCRDVANTVRPLYDLMVQRVLQSHVIATDDTVMPMLAPGSGKAKQGRMWVYLGDHDHPYNLFDFTLSRNRDGPASFLKDYGSTPSTSSGQASSPQGNQTLLADGYGGYDGVVVSNDITRAGCWAHARRKFVDAEKTSPAIAAEAVKLIRQLYAIEAEAKEMSHADRWCLRQARSQAILQTFKDQLFAWKDQLLPKHPMAEAVNYTLNQWQALSVFVSDGAVPIDNNASEREMKRIVLNRKNSLFVGNPRGGETAAILASLTSTCRRHNLDPQHYLTQMLTNLPDTPVSQLPQWLPDQWKKNQSASPAV